MLDRICVEEQQQHQRRHNIIIVIIVTAQTNILGIEQRPKRDSFFFLSFFLEIENECMRHECVLDLKQEHIFQNLYKNYNNRQTKNKMDEHWSDRDRETLQRNQSNGCIPLPM